MGIISFSLLLVAGVGLYRNISRRQMTKDKPKLNQRVLDVATTELSDEQRQLFDILEEGNSNVFITGKAGTGKSVLLQYFKNNTSKNVVVAAPTGVAALNVGGQTIHSLFKIKPGFIDPEQLVPNYKTSELLQHVDTVVIDEISMVRADLMDAIDAVLRKARRNSLPFGGAQMVMFGDLYQLPPIVEDRELHKYFFDNHGGFFFFNAHVWKDAQMDLYELTHVFRQKDEAFKELLNAVREGKLTDDHLQLINSRVSMDLPADGVITLATTNQTVSEINQRRLSLLPGTEHEYKAAVSGEMERTYFPTDENLRLKEGAQVMFLKNDRDKRWVNGTIGIVERLDREEVHVNIDGISYTVGPETWNKIRYTYNRETHKIDEEVISSFTQYPLKLAWALTIHKAQGQTYGQVVIDIGTGAFAAGQTYVALSRCRSLDGLYLKREIMIQDIQVDPLVVQFMNHVRPISFSL
jgi:ATP-dependent DNA helicase PIF1